MSNASYRKMVLASLFIAIAVVGSTFSFPVFGSRCAPVQHAINVLSGVYLGPTYAVIVAFIASFLRNIFALGTLLAFPGSLFGAWIAAMVFRTTHSIGWACVGECIGTGLLGGLAAYPVAVFFLGKIAGQIGFFTYVGPFFISTLGGSIIGGLIAYLVMRSQTSVHRG